MAAEQPPPAPIVDAQETIALTKSGGATYVDVRTPQEFAEGHPPGAVNVPVALQGAAGPSHDALEPNPNFVEEVKQRVPGASSGTLVLACGAGRRAARAAGLLSEAGFGDLKIYKGGWTDWKAQGLPVEGGPGKEPAADA